MERWTWWCFCKPPALCADPADNDAAVDKFLADQSDSLFSSALLEDSFIFAQRDGNLAGINFDYKNRPRRQDVEPQYLENGSLWIFRPDLLRRENNRMGGRITTYVMELWQSLEIDSLEDLEMAAWYMRRNLLAEQAPVGRSLDLRVRRSGRLRLRRGDDRQPGLGR